MFDTPVVDNSSIQQDWDFKIKPHNNFFELHLTDVWNYRDLLWLLVRRDFVSFYKQTILGPLWFFIQPLLTTLMFTLVFSRMGGFSTDRLPGPLFYMAGITAWNYFSDCVTKTSSVFRDNANIFGKVYFPRLIMPLSIVVSSLVRFGVQLLLFLLLIIYYAFKGTQFQVTWAVLLFPIIVLLMALMGLGAGMIISAMTTKYRDLAFLLTFGIQLLMYATTVIYPLSSINGKYYWYVAANPMTAIIETFRYAFLGVGSFSWPALGVSAVVSIFLVLLGIIIFNKVEKNFVDTV
jgi:lipopolysaccharide transport system permease protein